MQHDASSTDEHKGGEKSPDEIVSKRLEKARRAYKEKFGDPDVSHVDEPCEICRVVTADQYETVQNEATGSKKEIPLCDGCLQKVRDYNAGKDVDFQSEMRLRERKMAEDSEASA